MSVPINCQIGSNRSQGNPDNEASDGDYKSWSFSVPEGKQEELEAIFDKLASEEWETE